jgi:hypothetical protein
MLNDQFLRSLLFNMSKKYSRFVSEINHMSFGMKGTSTLENGNYSIEYDEENGYYILHITNLNNPLDGGDLFNSSSLMFLESIEELYNITRNEVYYINDLQIIENESTFTFDVYFE